MPGERVRRKSNEQFNIKHSLKDISSWQLMYCGGAKPVVDTLRAINEKCNVPLKWVVVGEHGRSVRRYIQM